MNLTFHKRPRSSIGPSGRAAMQLLACCPRMPTDVVAAVLGMRHARSAAQLLARLRRSGLTRYQVTRLGPLLGSRRVRLWTLTVAGQSVLDVRGRLAPSAAACAHLPYGAPERWPEPVHQRDLPMQVAAYQLLARAVGDLPQPVRIAAWEHPWIRTLTAAESGRGRHVRLPAAAVLTDRRADHGRPIMRLLLLPDLGTAPLSSYHAALRGLIDLRQAHGFEEDDEPLLLVGVATLRDASGRAEAWRCLLEHVASRAGEPPLHAQVFAGEAARPGVDRRGQAEEVFALVARHPLLTRRQLASLIGTSVARIARLVTELAARGWVRPIQPEERVDARARATQQEIQQLGCVELTPAARREAARRLLVTAGLARRRHGLVHDDAARRRFLRHLQHTFGANAFFVDLAAVAMQASSRGGDEALLEWRSAAACARGRFRPDGYGCYRRGPWQFGFFLEYDRGTERSSHYAAKLATYYRYRDAGTYKRDYRTFPILLVATTSDLAEARFAHQAYLAHQHRGGLPLGVFLTTVGRIQHHPEGPLGPIWRGPGTAPWADRFARGRWLPGRAGRTSAEAGGQSAAVGPGECAWGYRNDEGGR